MPRLAAIPLVLLLLSGCASPGFVRGAKEYAPLVAGEYRQYATKDAELDTATKATRIADADALDAAGKDPVTLQAVETAWGQVRTPYTWYVDRDERLDPDERGLRAGNVARFDRLIEVEAERWIYGRGP